MRFKKKKFSSNIPNSRATIQNMAHKQCFRREIAFCQTENVRLGVFFILVIDQLLCNPPHPFATKKELSCDLFRSWSQTIGAKRTTYGVAISIYFAAAFFTLCKVIIMSVLQFFIGKSRAWFEHSRNGLHIWLTGQTCQLCPRLTECIILKYFGRAVQFGPNVVDRPTQLFYIWRFICCVNVQI